MKTKWVLLNLSTINLLNPDGISIILTHEGKPSGLDRFLYNFIKLNNYHPYEIILLTEGSVSDLKSIIEYYQKHAFISPLYYDKITASTKNKASDMAFYPNLLFIDSSIIYTYDILPEAFNILMNPRIGAVSVRFDRYPPILIDGDRNILHTGMTFKWNEVNSYFEPIAINAANFPELSLNHHSNCPALSGSFLLCRKCNFKILGGFRENVDLFTAESEFCLRIITELNKECICINTKHLHLANPSRLAPNCFPTKNVKENANTGQTKLFDKSSPNIYKGKIAVVCHVYYESQWPYLARLLNNIPQDFQLLITMPEDIYNDLSLEKQILKDFPLTKFIRCPNRGKDIAPFLSLLPSIIEDGYDLVLKIHTKRSHPQYGDAWRQLMLQSLIGSPETVTSIINSFATDPKLGMAGPELLFKSIRGHLNHNLRNIIKIWNLGHNNEELPGLWGFFAGSSFWIRPAPLKLLAETCKNLTYEDDNSKIDGQLAHAIERLIGLYILNAGYITGLISFDPVYKDKIRLSKTNLPGQLADEDIIHSLYRYTQQNISNKTDDDVKELTLDKY